MDVCQFPSEQSKAIQIVRELSGMATDVVCGTAASKGKVADIVPNTYGN